MKGMAILAGYPCTDASVDIQWAYHSPGIACVQYPPSRKRTADFLFSRRTFDSDNDKVIIYHHKQ